MGKVLLRQKRTPHIVLSNSTIDEGATTGRLVGTLSVMDGIGYTAFNVKTDPDNKFAIVGVEVENDAALDYETASSHLLTVEATGAGKPTIEETFAISVNDLSETNTELTQFGIGALIAGSPTTGQFWNGDYYVVGAYTALSQTPAFDGTRNGCMVNPAAGGNQGYDTRAANYNAGVRATYPISLVPGDSLVIAKSYAANPTGGAASKIEDAMVITCLASAPASPSTTFRPPYVAGAKPLWTFADINYALLPDETAPFVPNLTGTQTFLKRPFIDHGINVNNAQIHPNSQGIAYPQYLSSVVSQLAVLAMTNDAQRNEAAHRLIQYGIDSYHVALGNDKGWRAQGGFGQGRKGAIIFTGIVLEDTAMKAVAKFTTSFPTGYKFGEDGHTYQGDTKARWGADHTVFNPGSPYFGNHDMRDPTGAHDCTPYGASPFVTTPIPGAYMHCCTVHTQIGMALAISMLTGGRTTWDHAPFFDFIHRWTHEDLWLDQPGRTNTPFYREIYQFGGGQLTTIPVSVDTHGPSSGGTYPQAFMKYMFDNYWVAP